MLDKHLWSVAICLFPSLWAQDGPRASQQSNESRMEATRQAARPVRISS